MAVAAECGLIAEVQGSRLQDAVVDIVKEVVRELAPLAVRIFIYTAEGVIGAVRPCIAEDLLDEVDELDHRLLPVLVDVLQSRINSYFERLALCSMLDSFCHFFHRSFINLS